MSAHLTFFHEFTVQTERLYWTLQNLYDLEQEDTLTPEQQTALLKYRLAAREQLRMFRELLNSIEREHGLEPEQVIRPATGGSEP